MQKNQVMNPKMNPKMEVISEGELKILEVDNIFKGINDLAKKHKIPLNTLVAIEQRMLLSAFDAYTDEEFINYLENSVHLDSEESKNIVMDIHKEILTPLSEKLRKARENGGLEPENKEEVPADPYLEKPE